MLVIIERIVFIITLILAILWTIDPNGNYEPYTVIGGLIFIAIDMIRRYSKKTESNNIIPNENQNNRTTDKLPLNPKTILNEIKKLPPYQQHEYSDKYNGIRVTWEGELSTIGKEENGNVVVFIRNTEWASNFISFKLKISDYPEIKVVPEKTLIKFEGTICKVDFDNIELENIKLHSKFFNTNDNSILEIDKNPEYWIFHRNNNEEYTCCRITVRNNGKTAAKNCKANIVINNLKYRVCWTVPNECPDATINTKDTEQVDLLAFLTDIRDIVQKEKPKIIAPTEDGWKEKAFDNRNISDINECHILITSANAEPVDAIIKIDKINSKIEII